MSFKAVAMGMAKKGNMSMDRASAMLAAGTRRTMKKRGLSTKHGIPKNVFGKKVFSAHHQTMRSVGAME